MLSRLKALIIIIPTLFLHAVTFAQTLPSGVSVPNLSVASGTTVGIPVRVEPGDVASADIWLQYDAAYLAPKNVVALGSLFSGSSISTDTSSTQVRIALARSSLVNVTAQATLVIVYFDVLQGSGTSTISFAKSLINGTEVTGTPGTITFTPIQQQPAGVFVPSLSAASGTTVGIPVRVEPGEVASADIWLEYDAAYLAPTGEVVSGSLFTGAFIDTTIRTDLIPAQVRIALAGSYLVDVAAQDTLVIVYFDVLQSSGTSTIGFAKTLVNGAEVTGTSGTITFTPIQQQPAGVSVPSLSAASGTTVGIPVRVEPGEVASADIWLEYNAAYLAPTGEVGLGSDFTGSTIATTIRTDLSPPQVRIALAGSELVNVSDQADLVIVYFDVLQSSGTSTMDFAKSLVNGAEVTGSPGTITFTPIQEQPAGVSVPDLSAASGMTVGIPVRVEPGGVASADIWLEYDAAYLTPTGDVASGELFTGSTIGDTIRTDLSPPQVRIALAGSELVNVTDQADLVIVYFNVLLGSGTSTIDFAKNLINGADVPGTLGTITFTTIQQPAGVSVPDLSVVSGTTVGIPVRIEPGEVASADIWLQYDAAYLTPTGDVGLGSDFTGSTIVKSIRTDLTPAQVRIALARSSLASVTEQADLVIVDFNVLQSSGTSPISFAKSLINGAEVTGTSGTITFTLQPSTFTLPHAIGDIGGTVTVALSSGSVSGVRGMDFWIAFDQTVITPTSATLDAGLVSQGFQMQQNLSDPGFAKLSIASGSPQNISGDLVYITFDIEGSASDSTALTFNKIVINEGAISPTTQSGSVAVNGPPELSAPGSHSITIGNTVSFTLSASDPDGDALTFSSPDLPSGASLDSESGAFSWTPTAVGSFTVTFQVSDGRLDSPAGSATITVLSAPQPPVNNPPVISPVEDQTVTELGTLLVNITVSDPDGDQVQVTAEPLPAGASFTFNPATGIGQIHYVPALGAAGVYNVTVLATDGSLSASRTIKITVNIASVPPVLATIGNRSVKVGERLAFQVSAKDPSGREAITLNMTGLPTGATFDPATGLFSFTPTSAQVGTHSLTATATNTSGLSDSEQFTITVIGVNRAPVFEPVPNQTVKAGKLLELTIVASDPDGDPVTLTAAGDPLTLGATFDPETGKFLWTPAETVIGNFRMIFVATDGKGGRTELAVIISVGTVNQPPVLGTLTDKQVSAGQLLSFTFTASDPDKDPLTLTVLNRPTGAVITFSDGKGTFSWRPTAEQVGSYKLDFIVKDMSLTDQKSITIEVVKVNRAPVISPISNRVISEGDRLDISVTASDPDNDPLVYSASGLPLGAVFDAALRIFSFQPSFTQSGIYSIKFTVIDPDGLSASATVSIEVKDVNRPPKFGYLANQTVEVGSTLELLVTATDPDNDPLTFTAQIPEGATFDAEARELSWTPAYADAGNHQATFTVKDGKGGTDSRSITISVTRPGVVINKPPVIDPIESKTVEARKTLSFNVTGSDPEQAELVLKATGVPTNASFNNLTGAFTFTPDYNQVGTYTTLFSASDGQLLDELPVTITVVRGVNQAPVISGVSDQAVAAGTSLRFVISASDPEGDKFSFGIRNLPPGAVFNAASGEFNYTPTNDQAGTYDVVFTATDVLGAASESTMVLTVTEVNHPPVFAKLGSIVAMVEQRVEYVVNATDPDGDVLTYSSPNAESLGATFNAETQMLTWTPQTAGTFKVTFVVTDGLGASAQKSVLATISSATQVINQPPVFDEIQNYVINAGASLTFTVSATDPEEAPLTYEAINLPTNSGFNASTRTFSFNPPLSQVGLFKPVFTVTDGKLTDQTLVEIQVNKVNQPPVLDEIPDRSVPEGGELKFFVTGNDPDNDPITLSAEGLPENASFLPAGGSFTFEPKFGQAGSYNVTFNVADPAGLTASQSVNIQVLKVNLPPVLGFIDNQETEIDGLLELFVSATDPNDDLSDLIFAAVGMPPGATFSAENRVFRWTPLTGQIGTFRVTFSVTDPSDLRDHKTILITVIDPTRPINHPPVLATVGNKSVQETNNLTFQVSATDPDQGDVMSLSIRGLPEGATFASTPAPNSVTGTFDYTPGMLDGGIYELTISVTDGDFVDEEKVVLEVVELNVQPEISGVEDHTARVDEELVFEVQGVDESSEAVVLSVLNPPPGAIFLQATGRFSFTPSLDQAGKTYAVNFRVTDASGLFDEATSNIEVLAVNLAPEFLYTPNQTAQENSLLEFTVQANDPNGDELTYSAENLPGGAAFDAENQIFSWVPQSDQAGSYQISFKVEDPAGLFDLIAVTVTVGDVNRPPSISNPGPQRVDEGSTLDFTVTATDPDEDQITMTAVNLPEGASFTDEGGGSGLFSWTPGYRDQGNYRVTFRASDGSLTSEVTIKIKVKNVNKPPTLRLVGGVLLSSAEMKFKHVDEGIRLSADVTEVRTFRVAEGGSITVQIEVSDPGGDALAVSVRNLPRNAWLDRNRARITFAPDYEQAGNYLVLVEVTDGVHTKSMYAAFQVIDTNRPPVLRPIGERYVHEGNIISFEINAYDLDKDPITYSFTGVPGVATLVNNLFTFDTQLLPPDLQVDAVRFVFSASDGRGGVDTQVNDIAVIRKQEIELGGETLLAASGDLPPGDSLNLGIGPGIGMNITITNSTGGTVNTGGSIVVSEISGPITGGNAGTLSGGGELNTLLAGTGVPSAGSGKQKMLGGISTIQLAGGLESGFTSLRRGWGADLTGFTPSWPLIPDSLMQDTLAVDSLMASDSLNIHITVTFQDSDMVIFMGDTLLTDSLFIDSLFRTGLVPAAWDSVLGKFVLLEGVVDTLTNQAYFIIPIVRDSLAGEPDTTSSGESLAGFGMNPVQITHVTASSRYKLFTVGTLLDFTAPSISVVSKSFSTSKPGPYKIVAEVRDELTGVKQVKLYYEIAGAAESASMELVDGKYEGLIPSQEYGTSIQYYIEAIDYQGNLTRDPKFITYVVTVSEMNPADLDNNAKVDIYDLIEFLKLWKDKDPAGDINLDGKTNVWDLITLLQTLKGESEAILAAGIEEDRLSPYNRLRALGQSAENKNWPKHFGVTITGPEEAIIAAEMVFKFSSDLEIGTLKLKVDDPAMQMIYYLEGESLHVLVFNLTGNTLPVGTLLFEVGYRLEADMPLTERMISLESFSFGDMEGNPVQASVSLDGVAPLPKAFTLAQNYPNPFNPSTTISYDIPEGDPVRVSLRVYNIRGQLVKVLVDEVRESGSYTVHWDGKDKHGRRLSSGVYFYRIQSGEFSKMRKMVILK